MKKILVLLLILFAAGFVRLYRIEDYLHFLGDEGRDVLVVKRIIVDHEFTLLGPITSVGSMYLGPIYYYFMIPFLFLFNMNPVGPAVMIALLSLATIALIYKMGIEFFTWGAAIIASLLYSFSPLVIVHSRFSWNPNAVPFFALLIIYALMKLVIKKQLNWAYIAGLSLGVIFQLHYLSLIFIPITFVVLLVFRQFTVKNLLKIFAGTVITLSPFIAFEIRHGFPNTQTVFGFVSRTGDTATFALSKFGLIIIDLTTRAFWRIVVIESNFVSKLLIVGLMFSLILMLIKRKEIKYFKALAILLIWFGISMIFFGLYTGAIYDYYMVVFFAFPALITGVVFSWLFSKNALFKIAVLSFLGLLLFYQFKNSPLLKEPNRLLALTRERAKFIFERIGNQPYNFALITGSNSDHAYRYFLELWGKPPKEIKNPVLDPNRETVTEQLFIICETKDCAPLGHPLWEIAGFGQAEIENSWEVAGVKIFKLVHLKKV